MLSNRKTLLQEKVDTPGFWYANGKWKYRCPFCDDSFGKVSSNTRKHTVKCAGILIFVEMGRKNTVIPTPPETSRRTASHRNSANGKVVHPNLSNNQDDPMTESGRQSIRSSLQEKAVDMDYKEKLEKEKEKEVTEEDKEKENLEEGAEEMDEESCVAEHDVAEILDELLSAAVHSGDMKWARFMPGEELVDLEHHLGKCIVGEPVSEECLRVLLRPVGRVNRREFVATLLTRLPGNNRGPVLIPAEDFYAEAARVVARNQLKSESPPASHAWRAHFEREMTSGAIKSHARAEKTVDQYTLYLFDGEDAFEKYVASTGYKLDDFFYSLHKPGYLPIGEC